MIVLIFGLNADVAEDGLYLGGGRKLNEIFSDAFSSLRAHVMKHVRIIYNPESKQILGDTINSNLRLCVGDLTRMDQALNSATTSTGRLLRGITETCGSARSKHCC